MNKAQQMRWSRRGADLLLQIRSAAIEGKLGSGFGLISMLTPILRPICLWLPESPLR
jgi:hypothetical protein